MPTYFRLVKLRISSSKLEFDVCVPHNNSLNGRSNDLSLLGALVI